MPSYKEIVTKAVIGKGKKYYKNTYTIDTDNIPTTVLGCWVINNKFKGTDVGGKIVIDGSFDVNLWYSYDNDTKTLVSKQTISYNELLNVSKKIESADHITMLDVQKILNDEFKIEFSLPHVCNIVRKLGFDYIESNDNKNNTLRKITNKSK